MKIASYFVAGLLFGLGLVISGLANPAKVLNFLDVAGTWDPSLAFVMIGAIATTAIGYKLVTNTPAPLFADRFYLPTATELDTRLIAGAALFGIGWGLAGYCPGPALTALPLGEHATILFVVAMIAGMYGARTINQTLAATTS